MYTVCWRISPDDRPTFVDILLQLREISNSPFITTSDASFRSLQQTWRVEIESCFAELRARDDVRTCQLVQQQQQVESIHSRSHRPTYQYFWLTVVAEHGCCTIHTESRNVKSQHKDDKSPLKGAWSGSRDPF